MILVGELTPGKSGISRSFAGHDDDHSRWSRFMEHVLAAFREPRGPLGGTLSGRKGDDDDDDDRAVQNPIVDRSIDRSLSSFDRLFDLLLSPANAPRLAITAFDLTHYICERLRADPVKAGAWLRRLIEALLTSNLAPERRESVAAAVLTQFGAKPEVDDETTLRNYEHIASTMGRAGGATRMRGLLLTVALICGALLTSASAEGWAVPDVDALPMDAFGRTVRVGRDLIVHTAATIGPDASDPAKRFSGNGLECESCHLDAGRKKFGLALAGVWGVFPQFISRENEVRTLEDRINGCMERSMNGRALPPDGPEMKAMLTYIRFISAGVPTGRGAEGLGVPPMPLPTAASDPKHGEAVFAKTCAVCHQANGQGKRWGAEEAAQRHRYQFPPLWGPDSYNDGAGMARPITAANFVRANMPLGTDYAHPVLSVQDAFDVAAFVDSQPRPHRLGNERDFPDRALKPADATYPPFLGPFPRSQHLTGPWQPIRQWQKDNAQTLRRNSASPGG